MRLELKACGRLLGLLCAVLLLLGANTSAAEVGDDTKVASHRPDAIVHTAWLDDPKSTLTPKDALAGEWTAYRGILARGYVQSTTWVRLRIDPSLAGPGSLSTDRRLVLRIEPSQLDQVVAYRTPDLGHPLAIVGDTVEPSRQPRGWLVHSVVIPDSVEAFDLLLQIRNQGAHTIHFTLHRWDDALDQDMWATFRLLAYMVFATTVVMWSASFWLRRRDVPLAIFVANQLLGMVFMAAHMGLMRLWASDWIRPEAIDLIAAVGLQTFTLAQVGFHVLLLPGLGAREPDRRWIRWLLLQPAVALILMAAGFRQLGLQLSVSTGIIAMPILLVVAVRCRHEAAGPSSALLPWYRIYLISTYTALFAITVPQVLMVLGLKRREEPDFYWFLIYNIVGTLLMSGLLWYRARQVEAERLPMKQALAEANRLEQLQRARASEQSDLVTMLVHELRTPLSVVSLSVGRMPPGQSMRELALQSVSAMSDVIERCAEIARFDDISNRDIVRSLTEQMDAIAMLRECASLQASADRININAQAKLPECFTDSQMVRMILNNLLDNALKYSPESSRVNLSARSEQREGCQGIVIQVSNAVGRAGRPDPNRVFKKYHREQQARYRSGSGLGLYLSSRIAARNGVALKLLPGAEVIFEFWIPCIPPIDSGRTV